MMRIGLHQQGVEAQELRPVGEDLQDREDGAGEIFYG